MSLGGNDNVNNNNSNNIIFSIKDTKVTLSGKDNQNLSKRLSKGLERSVHWNKYKIKGENKNTKNEYRYFLESIFLDCLL